MTNRWPCRGSDSTPVFAESDALHALSGAGHLSLDQMLAVYCRLGVPRLAASDQMLYLSVEHNRNRAPVAQWIEHLTSDQKVEGSNPPGRANFSS